MSSKANNSPAEYECRKTAISENNLKKPTRPLTAYHLFFQLEREYILQTTPATGDPNNDPTRPRIDDRPIGKEIDPEIPHRYRCVRLSPHWRISGSGKRTGKEIKKRRHRKTHGKIGFLELSKRIAARWADLEEKDRETKVYVTRIAGRELEAYRRAVKEYNKDKNINEMKLWIKQTSGSSLDGMPTKSAGKAVATATPPENMGRATAASSSQSAMPSLPWSESEGNSMSYKQAESMPSPNYKATASVSEANSTDLKVDSIDAYETKLWIKRASRMYLGDLAEKGPRRSSDPGIRSKLSFDSFEMPGSSAQALYGHGRREAMPSVPRERLRHSFTSASLFRGAGGGGNSGQGNAHCGIREMNYELDSFPSRTDQQRDRSQGRGCDSGSIAPISHLPPSALDDARGHCNTCRGIDQSNEPDAFLSRTDHRRGGGRGGFGIGTSGATPINHRPPSIFDNTLGPTGIESPHLGLEDAVGITSEDAMGLMKALSDNE